MPEPDFNEESLLLISALRRLDAVSVVWDTTGGGIVTSVILPCRLAMEILKTLIITLIS